MNQTKTDMTNAGADSMFEHFSYELDILPLWLNMISVISKRLKFR